MFGTLGSNYRNAMKCWFEWAPGYLDVQDPVGHSGSLGSSLSWATRTALNSRLSEAKDRAINALAHEAAGNHAEAKRLWKIEMGTEFSTA